MPKKILITGGAGFIGSHTADLLLSENYEVVVYDNLSTGHLANLDLKHPRLKWIEADIADAERLSREIAHCDAVMHLAAIASVPQSIENPVQSLQVNVLGFLNVLQAIRAQKKPIRLVYASSAAVYGDEKNLPCDDHLPLAENVLSPYALEKANDERYAMLFEKLFSIKSLGLRYFNVYGKRQDPKSPYSGVISKFMANYLENKSITIFGDGKQSRDFVHVSDVARANFLALTSECSGVMNIATGKPETLLDLVRYIESTGDHALTIDLAGARAGDIRESYALVKRAKEWLGFVAEMRLQEGIQLLS
jgi:UDP-glucose 4-epimerase